MSILFISYTDLERNTSGSGVRPAKMLKAFQELGQEVYALTGEQGRWRERVAKIRAAKKWVKRCCPDICYIESSTYPIMLWQDICFIRFLHRRGVSIGYFYRDFYRKFPELFPRRTGGLNVLKELFLDVCQWVTDRVLNNVDIVYLPSEESKELFSYHDMRVLPPAGENCLTERKSKSNTLIYVGGIIGHYDLAVLLDSLSILNAKEIKYRLICICRKGEWEKFVHPKKNVEWLVVCQASGEELVKYYLMADAGVLVPQKDNRYNQLAVSVKLFEYMSYGLPVIQVSSNAMNRIVEENEIGIITKSTAMDLADGINRLLSDSVLYEKCGKRTREVLIEKHLWIHRAQQVMNDLEALKSGNEDI